jgi:hypothetical protein
MIFPKSATIFKLKSFRFKGFLKLLASTVTKGLLRANNSQMNGCSDFRKLLQTVFFKIREKLSTLAALGNLFMVLPTALGKTLHDCTSDVR